MSKSKNGKGQGNEPTPNDQRSNALNPNSAASKAGRDNRSNQMNPNNPAHPSNAQKPGSGQGK